MNSNVAYFKISVKEGNSLLQNVAAFNLIYEYGTEQTGRERWCFVRFAIRPNKTVQTVFVHNGIAQTLM